MKIEDRAAAAHHIYNGRPSSLSLSLSLPMPPSSSSSTHR